MDSVFQAAVDFGRNGPRETDVTMHSFDSSFLVHVRDCLQFELNGCDGVGVGVTVQVPPRVGGGGVVVCVCVFVCVLWRLQLDMRGTGRCVRACGCCVVRGVFLSSYTARRLSRPRVLCSPLIWATFVVRRAPASPLLCVALSIPVCFLACLASSCLFPCATCGAVCSADGHSGGGVGCEPVRRARGRMGAPREVCAARRR